MPPTDRSSRHDEVGTFIKRIDISTTVTVTTGPITRISVHPINVKDVSSYNWLEATTPTIMVPGAPPQWAPKTLPTRVPQDRGLCYIDQNASRNPAYPLEPLFRSIYAITPTFDPKPFHLVTDRNNLRKLLRVISGESYEPFRIDIELVGETLLFTRWENETKEIITEFRGFGHEFEKMFTTSKGRKESTGHHRIIQYQWGPLKMLVRFEADAYVQATVAETASTPAPSKQVDELASAMKSIQLEPGAKQSLKSDEMANAGDKRLRSSDIKIIREGFTIPHDSILEIKTRASHKRIVMNEVAPQLFFAQAPHLVVGYHRRGIFQTLVPQDLRKSGAFRTFEHDYGDQLRKVIQVIENIKKELKSVEEMRAVLLCEGGSITLFKRNGDKRALPPDLLTKWG